MLELNVKNVGNACLPGICRIIQYGCSCLVIGLEHNLMTGSDYTIILSLDELKLLNSNLLSVMSVIVSEAVFAFTMSGYFCFSFSLLD